MKNKSETDNFILKMGTSNKKIPIVYAQDSEDIIVKDKGKLTNKIQRYNSGESVVFQCPKCKDYIGKGKITNEPEDNVKIFCFTCKEYFSFSNSLNFKKDALWYKPSKQDQRIKFEQEMNTFIEEKKPKIIDK